jgi:hypothetical protein
MSRRIASLGLAFGVAILTSITAAQVVSAGVESQSAPFAEQTIDRSYLCTNGVRAGGLRDAWVSAKTAYLGEGSWTWLGRVSIGNRGKTPTKVGPDQTGRFATAYTHWGFSISAGEGTSSHPLEQPGLAIWSRWARACKVLPTARRVALSARGLNGGAVDYYGDDYNCPAPRKVFVRVRAVLSAATSFRLDRRSGYLEAVAPVQEGVIAVRRQSGKPFAYVSVNQSGKARIFTAPACVAD